MKALDDAIAEELRAIAPDGTEVFYESAPLDYPPPYFVHKSTDSRKGRIGTAGFGGAGNSSEARQYEHSILAVDRDPDETERLREAVYDRLQYRRLAPAGWQSTTPVDWAGEIHDPGEMLPAGFLEYFAGDRYTIDIYRTRA